MPLGRPPPNAKRVAHSGSFGERGQIDVGQAVVGVSGELPEVSEVAIALRAELPQPHFGARFSGGEEASGDVLQSMSVSAARSSPWDMAFLAHRGCFKTSLSRSRVAPCPASSIVANYFLRGRQHGVSSGTRDTGCY